MTMHGQTCISISITLFYVEAWGVDAQSPEPGAHVKNA